jgi:hypothetical protein
MRKLGWVSVVVAAAWAGGCAPSDGAGGGVQLASGALGVAPAAPTVLYAPSSCTLSVTITWQPPAGVAPSSIQGYDVLRDGNIVTYPGYASIGFWDGVELLPGASYSYQIAWRDQTGAQSALSPPLQITMPPRCVHPEFADGKVTLGVVLVKFQDAPPTPYTPDQVAGWVFQDPHSAAAYMNEVSRGRVGIQGAAYGWFTLPYNIADRCPTLLQGLGVNCNLGVDELASLAAANGVPVANYERLAFYVDGMFAEGLTDGEKGCMMQGSHDAISPGTLIHECFGHAFGLEHAGGWDCGPAGSDIREPGPSLTDQTQGGCLPGRYTDPFDPMAVSIHHFSTQNLWLLGLLDDQERVTAQPGGTYWVGKLTSNVHPIKELQIPLPLGHFFYFVEYRAAEGFNALTNCNSCAPRLNGTFTPSPGVYVRLWLDARYPGSDDNTLNVTQTPYRAGQSFFDPYRGIKVATLAEDGDGALVQVSFCGDGVKDGDETDVDCGGSCGVCPDGNTCLAGTDCSSHVCASGVCRTSCSDNVKNGNEVDVDCGGSCAPCGNGRFCAAATDCLSQRCLNSACLAPTTCFNGVQDGSELGVDCDGVCDARCPDGTRCHVASDCASSSCILGRCMTLCNDQVRNGAETDVDCGGGTCGACAVGLRCLAGTDCASALCIAGKCAPATCADGVRDGDEASPDCGGASCARCADGVHCSTAHDCASSSCILGHCMSLCNDQVKNGAETDVDCGGGTCAACAVGLRCLAGTDCASGTCLGGKCAPATCADGVKDGDESAVDCGGASCPSCADGSHCSTGHDCASSSCILGHCMSICNDQVKNGAETDVDCGGGTCGGCDLGQRCSLGRDCASGNCVAGLCHV